MTVLIASGELNRRISLQNFSGSQDDVGQVTRTWSEVAKPWARITTLKTQRSVIAGGINVEITHQIRIRHRAGVVPDMRVVYGSRIFIVHEVDDPEEAHVALDLFCSEGSRED